MSKFLTIMKMEYMQVVKKKSFIIGIFLTPVLMAAFMLLPAFFASKGSSTTESIVIIDRGELGLGDAFAERLKKYKIADTETPAYDIKEIHIVSDDDDSYSSLYDTFALEITNKKIKYFLVIGKNAVYNDTDLFLVTNSDNFTSLRRFEYQLSQLISSHKLSESNVNLSVDSILTLTARLDLQIKDTKGDSIPFFMKYIVALIFVMLIFGLVINYGQVLMRSVIDEKNSRIMEVLVSSVTPFQMMLGKVIGLGMAAFTQVAIWVIIGGVISVMPASLGIDIDSNITRIVFNPAIVIFFVLFFIAGYLLYSTIFAFIGSIVNSDKEAQQFLFPITISLITPMIIAMAVIQDPHATWVSVLSMIPIFAPTLMVMRVSFLAPTLTEYSLFSGIISEAILAFIILIITVLGMIWLTGKVFRIGILMYGKRPTLPEIMQWIKYS